MAGNKVQIDFFDRDVYFSQILGITCMMSWLSRWEILREWADTSTPLIALTRNQSQRFALGIPHSAKYGKNPFLTIQSAEEEFFSRIKWVRALVDKKNCKLILVSQKLLGDSDNLADVPAFAISIEFDSVEKFDFLNKSSVLDFRGLWFDEDDAPQVTAGLPISSVLLMELNEGDKVFQDREISQDRSLLEISILKQQELSLLKPSYEGAIPELLGEFNDFIKPFDPSEVPLVRYDGYVDRSKKEVKKSQ